MEDVDKVEGVEVVNHRRWVSFAAIGNVAVMKRVIEAVCDTHGRGCSINVIKTINVVVDNYWGLKKYGRSNEVDLFDDHTHELNLCGADDTSCSGYKLICVHYPASLLCK